jgi:hypothetical protein
VTAVERPFGLAVTDDEYSGSRHGGRREEWGVRGAESEGEEEGMGDMSTSTNASL